MSHEDETEFELNQEFTRLAQALHEVRPTPEPEFTERLDQAVADHFPPEWADEAALGRKSDGRIGTFAERFRRWLAGNRTLIPTLTGAVGVLFVVAVVAINSNSGLDLGDGRNQGRDMAATADDAPTSASGGAMALEDSVSEQASPGGARQFKRTGTRLSSAGPEAEGLASGSGNRDVAREAEITLGTDPDGVQDVANEVVSVTDKHKGIVMDSKVTDGEKGKAGASFSLLIPAGEMESAVADLSAIADLRSRSQELTDITAPVAKTEDGISDSKARIEKFKGELEQSYDEDERAAIERNIRWERQQLRWQETRLKRLERRIDYTPVAVTVETSGDTSSEDSAWGITDAFDDAGKLLGIAAGVTVLALAVAIPIGIVLLIALALNRAWVRRSRRRVLADDE